MLWAATLMYVMNPTKTDNVTFLYITIIIEVYIQYYYSYSKTNQSPIFLSFSSV